MIIYSTISHSHVKSMCDSFGVLCTEKTLERYSRPSTIHIIFDEQLNLIIEKHHIYWYIDKLWIVQKRHGIGTKCFKAFLAKSDNTLIWRAKKNI